MDPELGVSEFASPQRDGQPEIERAVRLISDVPCLYSHFDAVPDIVVIINKNRQVVFANRAAEVALRVSDRSAVYGLRLGEVLNCVHAGQSQSGCGTTAFCRECGAVRAMLASLAGNSSVDECRVVTRGADSLDFRVTSTPYEVAGERYSIFVVAEISHEKRRQVLERVFFHDVANTLSSVLACIEFMPLHATPEENDLAEKISRGVNMLVDELKAQQALLRAEDGQLVLGPCTIQSLEFLDEIAGMYRHQRCAQDKTVAIDTAAEAVTFVSDRTLLSRVVGNMLKNALEASSAGDRVRMGCERVGMDAVSFWVWNAQSMPTEVQLQVFNRSFSTKGLGRGIGTYSMRLLGERYLGGNVSFISSAADGTTFRIVLPLAR